MVTAWSRCIRPSVPGAVLVCLLGVPPLARAQQALFADTFERADARNLDASLNGITDGTGSGLSPDQVYVQPYVDPANETTGPDSLPGNGGGAQIANGQLELAEGSGTSNVFVDHNFTNGQILAAGGFKVSIEVIGMGQTGDGQGGGFAVGMTRAGAIDTGDAMNGEGSSTSLFKFTDGFTGAGNGATSIAVSDFWLLLRGDGSLIWGGAGNAVTGSANDGPAFFGSTSVGSNTGTLSAEFHLDSFAVGSRVDFEVFFDGVSRGAGSFTWDAGNANYLGLDARDGQGVFFDNFRVTLPGPPAPEASLVADPGIVPAGSSSEPVTLAWSAANVSTAATYRIDADPPAVFPNADSAGPVGEGSGVVTALVDGTTGDTTFSLAIIDGAVTAATAQVTVRQRRPNVIVILADDTGWSDYGCYGSFIQTPAIDALAEGGVRFRSFYQAARCSPTRNALLTGLYAQQAAVNPGASLPDMKAHADVGANNVTIAEVLADRGYRTYMAGKWHVGGGGRAPVNRGFQHVFGQGTDGSGSNTTSAFGYWEEGQYHLAPDPEITPIDYSGQQFHYTDAIGDYAVRFIDHHVAQRDGAPFFLYLAFNAPHWPVCAPAELANKYTDVADPNPADVDVVRYELGWDFLRQQTYSNQLAAGVITPACQLSDKSDHPSPVSPIDDWSTLTTAQRNDLARRMAVYAAMIEQVDRNIGKVVTRLTELGERDNTVIFLCNDNGANYEGGEFGNSTSSSFTPWAAADLPHMGQPENANNSAYPRVNQGGAWANLSNTPFRLFKHFVHNGGVRTSAILNWPEGTSPAAAGTWCDERGHLIDVMATVVDAAKAIYPTQYMGHAVAPMEGASLLPALRGDPLAPSGHRAEGIGIEHESNRAWFSGKWKFVTKNFSLSDGSSPANELELYDMEADPSETVNLATQEPVVLADMVAAWNSWAQRVGVPADRLLLPPPPQVDPAPMEADLFVDTFNRLNNGDHDAETTGMWGDRLPLLGPGATYYDAWEAGSTEVSGLGLGMAVGSSGMTETALQHNFVGADVLAAGGFSVQVRVDAIDSSISDAANRYAGIAVGLSETEAQSSNDAGSSTPPYSFRGREDNPVGTADFFVDLDLEGNIKAWSNGTLLDTVPVGQTTGTLLVSFELDSFAAGAPVTATVFLDGRRVDLDSTGPATTRTFSWDATESNYIGLSARASVGVRLDNLAIRRLPLRGTFSSDYAQTAGLSAGDAALDADPDSDGDSNYQEWLRFGDPAAADSHEKLLALARNADGEFRFAYVRVLEADKAGLHYVFRYATELGDPPDTWTAFAPETVKSTPLGETHELLDVRLPAALAVNASHVFVHLLVEGNSGLDSGAKSGKL